VPKTHPYTPLTCAICAVVLVLVAHNVWVSAAAIAVAVMVAAVTRRARGPLLAAVALAIPTGVGLMLMYAPFGRHPVLGPITSDGALIAATLTLRLFAAAAVGLTLGSLIDGDRLMRAMQEHVPAKLVYVAASTVRLYSMARARLETLRQVTAARGLPTSGFRANASLAMPLIVGLVDDAAMRSRPLQRTGIGEPGPRTVLNPVPNPLGQRVLRWVLIVATAVAVVWIGVA